MASEETPTSKFLWIAVSGIVSLVVGITSAFLITRFTDNAPLLTYDVTALESFPGETQKLGIVALRISNSGGKEVEALQCRIDLKNANLKEPRNSGLAAASPKMKYDESYVEISVPFLNPKEEFSLQLLVEPNGDTLEVPDIDIRGKGVVAQIQEPEPKRALKIHEILVPILFTSATALGIASLGIRRLFVGLGGLGVEQRDGFAFLLGLHGFTDEAVELRHSNREYSWWTLSDALTERLVSGDTVDKAIVKRGIAVLEDLVSHRHGMAKGSKAIIYTNLARLAEAMGDSLSATRYLQTATKTDNSTALRRTELVAPLKKLTKGAVNKSPAG